jgi:hypothetical protein
MAEHTWCSERASRLQEGCFLITRTEEQRKNLQGEVVIHPQLERFLRYQAHHDRAYQRASAELLKRRKERLLAERGFVLQKHAEAQETRREEMHFYAAERAKTAVALDTAKLERKTMRKETVKTAAASQTASCKPPQEEPLAA